MTEKKHSSEHQKAILDEAIFATEALLRAEKQFNIAMHALMAIVAIASTGKDPEVVTLAKNVAEGAKSTRPGVRQMLFGFRALATLIKQRPVHISLSIETEKP